MNRCVIRCLWICILLFSSVFSVAQKVAATKKTVKKADETFPFYIPVRAEKLWGYADSSKHIVITPQFDEANPFMRKYAVVEKNKKAFVIDRKGKIVSPGFDQLQQIDDTVLSIYNNDATDTIGGWGISTVAGRKLLTPAYDEVEQLNFQVFAFRKNKQWGMVNIDGTVLSQPQYDTIRGYGPNYVFVSKDGKIGIVRNDGKIILESEYNQIARPNLFAFAAKTKKKWGTVDNNGDAFIPFEFDTIQSINRYFIQAKKHDTLAFYFTRNIHASTPCIYKNFIPTAWYWLKIYDFKDHCGIADSNGVVIIPATFKDVMATSFGDWLVEDSLKKWGLYAADGKELIPPRFSRIQPFVGNVAVAFLGGESCLINSNGETIIPFADQQINIRGNVVKVLLPDSSAIFYTINSAGKIEDKSNYEKLRTIKITGKEDGPKKKVIYVSGIDTLSGSLVYAPPSDSLDWFLDDSTSLWGMRNLFTNEIIFQPQFTNVRRCFGKLTLVELPDTLNGPIIDSLPSFTNGSMGLVSDTTGKFILHPIYSSINTNDLAYGFSHCVRATLKDGQQAIVSTDGKETTTIFTWIDYCNQGVARICVQGKFATEGSGEPVLSIKKFIDNQNLNGFLSFGTSISSTGFLDKSIRIVGGKWGYIDSTGKILIDPQYDAEKISYSKTGIVKKEKKWGLIDTTNKIILPFNYDGLNYLFTDKQTFVQAQNNGLRYGYIDDKGNVVIAADLRQTISMGNGFIGFSRTGKWGVMNPKGETICLENYQEVLPFSEGFAQVRRGKLWGYIDTLGKEITAIVYQKTGKFSNGMARVMKDSRWGFINTAGTLIIENKYLLAGDFLGNAAPVKTKTGFGLISKQDKILLKPIWLDISQLDASNFFVIKNETAKGICRSDGKVIVAAKYVTFKFLDEGRIAFNSGAGWGMVDTSGRTITAAVFDKILPFSQNRAAAEQNSLWGFVNRNGRFVIPAQFRSASSFSENLAYVFVPHASGCYIDTTGKIVFWIGDDCTGYPYSDGKALVKYLDKFNVEHYYYINRRGFSINSFMYDNAKPFKDGAARVCSQKVWGMVSFTGFYLIKPRFYQLDEFDHGLARFQLRYTYGLYALNGKEILPMQYDAIYWNWELGMIRFERGNSLGYLFGDGRTCWAEKE